MITCVEIGFTYGVQFMQENAPEPKRSWRDLAADAAKEKDPERLNKLIEDLCRAFDEEQRSTQKPR